MAHFTFTKAKMNYARYSYIKMSPWVMIYLWKSLSYHLSGSITYLTSVIKCVVLFSTFDSFFVLCCILGTPHHEVKIWFTTMWSRSDIQADTGSALPYRYNSITRGYFLLLPKPRLHLENMGTPPIRPMTPRLCSRLPRRLDTLPASKMCVSN